MSVAVASPFIRGLFDVEVGAAELEGIGDPSALSAEELEGQDRWVSSRRCEFAAGRQCAHLALGQIGITGAIVRRKSDRSPRWPDGVCGSITHSGGFAAAAVAPRARVRSLGIDVEARGRLEAHLWESVLTGSELEWLMMQDESDRKDWALLLFSAKEAFYKCQYPVTGEMLDFSQVTIDTASLGESPTATVRLSAMTVDLVLTGRAGWRPTYVATGFAWPAPASAA